MATFIEIRTDAFAENVNRAARDRTRNEGVRRPLRGIEIKDDTYAVMKVLRADGSAIPLVDAGSFEPPVSGGNTTAGSGIPSHYPVGGRQPTREAADHRDVW
jgi:hypothetical protein